MFDHDGDGEIDSEEFKAVLGTEKANIDDEVFKELMNEVDVN